MSRRNPSVLWSVDQSLSAAEKLKARQNIGIKFASGDSATPSGNQYDETNNKIVTQKDLTSTIEGLDKAEVGESGKYVEKIKEDDGIITATLATMNTSIMDVTDADTLKKAPTTGAVKTAIENLDSAEVGTSGKYVEKVKEVDGIVTATLATMNTSIMDVTDADTLKKAPTTGAVKTAIENLDSAEVGASGKYVEKVKEVDGIVTATLATMNTSIMDVTDTDALTKAATTGAIKTAVDNADKIVYITLDNTAADIQQILDANKFPVLVIGTTGNKQYIPFVNKYNMGWGTTNYRYAFKISCGGYPYSFPDRHSVQYICTEQSNPQWEGPMFTSDAYGSSDPRIIVSRSEGSSSTGNNSISLATDYAIMTDNYYNYTYQSIDTRRNYQRIATLKCPAYLSTKDWEYHVINLEIIVNEVGYSGSHDDHQWDSIHTGRFSLSIANEYMWSPSTASYSTLHAENAHGQWIYYTNPNTTIRLKTLRLYKSVEDNQITYELWLYHEYAQELTFKVIENEEHHTIITNQGNFHEPVYHSHLPWDVKWLIGGMRDTEPDLTLVNSWDPSSATSMGTVSSIAAGIGIKTSLANSDPITSSGTLSCNLKSNATLLGVSANSLKTPATNRNVFPVVADSNSQLAVVVDDLLTDQYTADETIYGWHIGKATLKKGAAAGFDTAQFHATVMINSWTATGSGYYWEDTNPDTKKGSSPSFRNADVFYGYLRIIVRHTTAANPGRVSANACLQNLMPNADTTDVTKNGFAVYVKRTSDSENVYFDFYIGGNSMTDLMNVGKQYMNITIKDMLDMYGADMNGRNNFRIDSNWYTNPTLTRVTTAMNDTLRFPTSRTAFVHDSYNSVGSADTPIWIDQYGQFKECASIKQSPLIFNMGALYGRAMYADNSDELTGLMNEIREAAIVRYDDDSTGSAYTAGRKSPHRPVFMFEFGEVTTMATWYKLEHIRVDTVSTVGARYYRITLEFSYMFAAEDDTTMHTYTPARMYTWKISIMTDEDYSSYWNRETAPAVETNIYNTDLSGTYDSTKQGTIFFL